MSGIACIVGAGDMTGTRLYIPVGSLVIAADGGLSPLKNEGCEPALIVGDFDSLGTVPQGDNVLRLPPEKDDTDMLFCVRLALERGADTLLIYGGLGGRFEHSIANLQTLAFIANSGARGYLIGCGSVCTVIKNSALRFDDSMSGYVSVFCLGSSASGVDLEGLKYPLSNQTLSGDFPLGVSNEFLGAPSSVSVREGLLCVIWGSEGNKIEGVLKQNRA